jgi:hypothetical protein
MSRIIIGQRLSDVALAVGEVAACDPDAPAARKVVSAIR